jgi:hypothetical protein
MPCSRRSWNNTHRHETERFNPNLEVPGLLLYILTKLVHDARPLMSGWSLYRIRESSALTLGGIAVGMDLGPGRKAP